MPAARPMSSPAEAGSSTRPVRQLAVASPAAVLIFLVLTAGGLLGDLLSKHYVFRSMLDDPAIAQRVKQLQTDWGPKLPGPTILQMLRVSRPVMPGVQFTLSTNPGVVFGLPMPSWGVLAATVATVALVLFFFGASPRRAWAVHLSLAFILAGALGNLYDRVLGEVALPGVEPIRNHVRDFIDCHQIGYRWVFNVADALLVLGVFVLIVHWWFAGRKSAKAAAAGRK